MQKLIYTFTGILWYFVSTSYTWNLEPKKEKKKKKKKGNHEPTSQIKTSLTVNEDISKQR